MHQTFAAMAALMLFLSSAFAQEREYQFTPPSGWTQGMQEGGVVSLNPPGDAAHDAAILLLPVQPLDQDFEAKASGALASLEAGLGLSEPRLEPTQRGQIGDGEYVMFSGSYVMEQNGQKGPLYVMIFARGEKGFFGLSTFMTAKLENVSQYGVPATTFFAGLRLIETTAQAQSNTASRQGDSPSAASDGQGKKMGAQEFRQTQYEECLKHCRTMQSMCNFSGGTSNPYAQSCFSSNLSCQTGCMVYRRTQ